MREKVRETVKEREGGSMSNVIRDEGSYRQDSSERTRTKNNGRRKNKRRKRKGRKWYNLLHREDKRKKELKRNGRAKIKRGPE